MPKLLTDLSTLTKPELLLLIVSAEKPCIDTEHIGSMCRYGCGMTGKVPILNPELMRMSCPCPPYCVAYSDSPDDQDWQRCSACGVNRSCPKHLDNVMGEHGSWCDNCHGSNWMPNPDAWDMKKALHLADFYLTEGNLFPFTGTGLWPTGTAVYKAHCRSRVQVESDVAWVWDADPERARLLAVGYAFGIGQ